MLSIERRQKILERLQQDKKVYVSVLSEDFKVTQETIRRDLERLEKKGLLQRSHGGAVSAHPTNEDLPFTIRTSAHSSEKQIIAQKAVNLINNGSTIMADSSTTVLTLVDLLQGKTDITIITNSVKLLNDYAGSSFSLIGTGGSLRAHSFALVGHQACQTLEDYNVDLALISCKGLDMDRGIMESNEPESLVKKTMIAQAKTTILLADHTKFDQVVFIKTIDFSDIDYVITDQEPQPEWVEFFRKKEVQLIC